MVDISPQFPVSWRIHRTYSCIRPLFSFTAIFSPGHFYYWTQYLCRLTQPCNKHLSCFCPFFFLFFLFFLTRYISGASWKLWRQIDQIVGHRLVNRFTWPVVFIISGGQPCMVKRVGGPANTCLLQVSFLIHQHMIMEIDHFIMLLRS